MNGKIKGIGMGILLLISSTGFAAEMKTLPLKIDGMYCSTCAKRVEGYLKKQSGVTQVSVDDQKGTGKVDYDATLIKQDQIIDACNKTGYRCAVGS